MRLTERLAFARRYARVAVADRRPDAGRCIAPAPHRPDPAAWPDDRLTVSWLGHATVLFNLSWARRSHRSGARATHRPRARAREGGPPAADPARAPQARAAPRSTRSCSRTPTWTTPTSAPCAPSRRGCGSSSSRATAISSAGSTRSTSSPGARPTRIGDLEVESIETRHWGARMVTDRHRGWGGYLLRKAGRTVLFGGDTAYTDVLRAARRARRRSISPSCRSGPTTRGSPATPRPRRPGGCSRPSARDYLLPIHHSTFRLSREPMDEPIRRLLAAAGASAAGW